MTQRICPLPVLANLIQPTHDIRIVGVSDGLLLGDNAGFDQFDQVLL
jgi:hypothetical protein